MLFRGQHTNANQIIFYHASRRCEQRYLFSVKNTLQLKHFQEVTPGEHAEGVIDLRSPGWSEAEPWVLNISMHPL